MNYPNIYADTSGVIEITTKDTHNKRIVRKDMTGRPIFMIFCAPWCSHCKMSAEMWSELAIQFRYIHPIVAINCENPENYPLCDQFKIEKYPTVYIQMPVVAGAAASKKGAKKIPTVSKYEGKTDKDTLLKAIYQNLVSI